MSGSDDNFETIDDRLSGMLRIDALLKCDCFSREKHPFSIPSYQRGYRWTEENVLALLEDLVEFADGNTRLYCLQPIVFKRCQIDIGSCSRQVYRIVDGQQRLTTMTILLRELGVPVPWDMYYEMVASSEGGTIAPEENKWLSDLLNTPKDDKGINGHFRTTNATTIRTWLKKGEHEVKIRKALGLESGNEKSVVFVGYLMDKTGVREEDEHELFDRLNDGRVPLTSAELIKALYQVSSSGLSEGDKLEISKEWELIERELHDEQLWRVFVADNKTPFTRIEELFAVIVNTSSSAGDEDPLAVYHDVEKRVCGNKKDGLIALWREVVELHRWMRSCYLDFEMANYIGWTTLFRPVSLSRLYSSYKSGEIIDWNGYLTWPEVRSEKEQKIVREAYEVRLGRWGCFKKNVMSYIAQNIRESYPDVFANKNLDSVRYVANDYSNARRLRQLFVLLNICANNANHEYFRFDRYVAERSGRDPEGSVIGYGWDVDHIFLRSDAAEADDSINGIWNLTLIDARTNRGGAFKKTFESKRECIQRQMEGSPTDTSSRGEPGHYIPVLSQRVYMKFYSKEMSGTTWIRENDGKPYQEALEALLTKFIEAAKAVSLVRGADNE